MNEQVANKEWTEQDEAEYQAYLEDQEDEYEQSVRSYYASRGLSNIY